MRDAFGERITPYFIIFNMVYSLGILAIFLAVLDTSMRARAKEMALEFKMNKSKLLKKNISTTTKKSKNWLGSWIITSFGNEDDENITKESTDIIFDLRKTDEDNFHISERVLERWKDLYVAYNALIKSKVRIEQEHWSQKIWKTLSESMKNSENRLHETILMEKWCTVVIALTTSYYYHAVVNAAIIGNTISLACDRYPISDQESNRLES